MKTLEQFYEEIKASEDLKKALADVLAKKDKEALLSFNRENGCDASVEEIRAFLKEKMAEGEISAELTEEDLEKVTGGTGPEFMIILGGLITLSCFICD